jgi:hypothetical protein
VFNQPLGVVPGNSGVNIATTTPTSVSNPVKIVAPNVGSGAGAGGGLGGVIGGVAGAAGGLGGLLG